MKGFTALIRAVMSVHAVLQCVRKGKILEVRHVARFSSSVVPQAGPNMPSPLIDCISGDRQTGTAIPMS